MTMADQIAVMNEGRIEQLGTASELYDTPKTAFVANFLGTSNLIDAKVLSRSGDMAEVEADGGARLRVPASVLPGSDTEVRIGVRPEKLDLEAIDDGSPSANGDNVILGHITDAAFVGVSTQYVVHTEGGDELQVFVQNSADHPPNLGPGRRVAATWDPTTTFAVNREESDGA